jgi:hypothetical protein
MLETRNWSYLKGRNIMLEHLYLWEIVRLEHEERIARALQEQALHKNNLAPARPTRLPWWLALAPAWLADLSFWPEGRISIPLYERYDR